MTTWLHNSVQSILIAFEPHRRWLSRDIRTDMLYYLVCTIHTIQPGRCSRMLGATFPPFILLYYHSGEYTRHSGSVENMQYCMCLRARSLADAVDFRLSKLHLHRICCIIHIACWWYISNIMQLFASSCKRMQIELNCEQRKFAISFYISLFVEDQFNYPCRQKGI